MYHPKPDALEAFMSHGMATFSLDMQQNVSGFIKVDPWLSYQGGKPDADEVHGTASIFKHIATGAAKILGFESGSLVINPEYQNQGLGGTLKDQMAQFTVKQFPGIPLFSVVSDTNYANIHLNNKMKWPKITPVEAQKLTGIDFATVDDWDPTMPVSIFIYPPSIAGHQY